MRVGWAVIMIAMVAALFTGCASQALLKPTPQHPLNACYLSCPDGYSFRRQHMCKAGRRWFEDIQLIGENIVRGIDGAIVSAVWITQTGDYDKQDVEIGRCQDVIRQIVDSRAIQERGQHPGEDQYGQPKP